MRVEKIIPIQSDQGCMAFYQGQDGVFYGRKRPENYIFSGHLQPSVDSGEYRVEGVQRLLDPKVFSQTEDGRTVVGYEDPTYLSPMTNPFAAEPALLCTQTFVHDGEYGTTAAGEPLATNLVYWSLDRSEMPKALLTPKQLQLAGLGEYVSMIKEGELVVDYRGTHLIFEYVNTPPGNKGKQATVGMVDIEQGQLTNFKRWLEPFQWGYINLSTCGSPIELANGQRVLFLNASTANREWGVTWMDLETGKVHQQLLVRASADLGAGYGNQLIAFGSDVRKVDGHLLHIYYHANDLQSYIAEIEIQ